MSNVKRVGIDAEERDHLVRVGQFFDGTNRSACGVRPFPEKWYQDTLTVKTLCPACVATVNKRG